MTQDASQAFPDATVEALMRWWRTLVVENPSGTARADRATLRRAGDLTAVACLPAYQRVYRAMAEARGPGNWHEFQRDRIAAIVALLAHVKEDSGASLPEAMSQRRKDDNGQPLADRNPVSPLRFRRLLDTDDIETLFVGLRRALPLIDHRVDPRRLARDVFFWSDRTRKRWAYDYVWPAD